MTEPGPSANTGSKVAIKAAIALRHVGTITSRHPVPTIDAFKRALYPPFRAAFLETDVYGKRRGA